MPARSVLVVMGLLVPLAAPSPVRAQGAPRYNWQVEVHAGGAFGSASTDGTGSLPGPGVTFVPIAGAPESRAVTSWAFGDGAAFFNQVASAIGLSPRITPLDPVLTAAISRQRAGGNFGMRLTRVLTPRVSLEGSVDVNLRRGEFAADVGAGLEATRASYVEAFDALFASRPSTFANHQIVVTTTVSDRRGYEAIGTGALVIRFGGGALEPYLAIGGGVAGGLADFPSAALTADYQFTANGLPIHQRDRVIVRQKVGIGPVGLIGGGLRKDLTPRLGFRIDGRLHVGGGALTTRLEALPASISSGRVLVVFPQTAPAISFSAFSEARSSLSGSTSQASFTSSGARAIGAITVGFFVRM